MSNTDTLIKHDGSEDDLSLTITQIFDAPAALVFRMWAEPEHMSQWWAPPAFSIESIQMDFKADGAWQSHMRSPDGNDYKMGGEYRHIVPNQRIVMTHNWLAGHDGPKTETVITVDFTERDGKTELTFHQAGLSDVKTRDSHVGGWTKFMERLSAHIQTV